MAKKSSEGRFSPPEEEGFVVDIGEGDEDPNVRTTLTSSPPTKTEPEVSVSEIVALENKHEIFGVGRPILVGALRAAGIDINGTATKSQMREAIEAFMSAEAF